MDGQALRDAAISVGCLVLLAIAVVCLMNWYVGGCS